jgi:hypothetical protein
MKILSWIAGIGLSLGVVFLALAFSTASMGDDFSGEKPAVKTADRLEWAWDGGDRVAIGVPASVHYQAGGSPRVIVTGPADLLDRVRFYDGELELHQDLFGDGGGHGERLDVTLTGMTLHRVSLAGSADMDMGVIHQDALRLSIAGSGRFTASGNADDLSLNIAGSGSAQLDKLETHSMRVDIAGSGRVDAGSPQSARASIMGSGRLTFAAMPKDLTSHVAGSGRISDASGLVIDHDSERHRHWERS